MKKFWIPMILMISFMIYCLMFAPYLVPAKNIIIFFVFIFIFILIGLSFLLKKHWRSIQVVGLILAISTGIFYTVQPYYIQSQVPERQKELKTYLEKKYPNEKFTIQYAPNEFQTPYMFNVQFEKQQAVIYSYRVSRNGIGQISYMYKKNEDISIEPIFRE